MALTLQTSTGYLDLFEDEGISVDYNLADLRDPAVIFSPISKSFSVPATDANNQFFKHYYDVSIAGGFNPYAKQDVTLYSDDVIVIDGYLQLLDVAMEEGVPTQYQILVAGENARFAREVGEKELRDLALDSYVHTLSYENIVDSWDFGLFDGDIVYAPVDTRVFASDTLFGPQQLFTPMWESDFYPAIKTSVLFNQIFEDAGYTLEAGEGIMDDDNFTELYTLCYSKDSLVPLEATFNDRLAQVYSSDTLSIPDLTTTNPSKIVLNTEVYDNGGNFNTTANAYELPIVGEYKFNIQGTISFGTATGLRMYQITMYLGNVAIQTKDVITRSIFSIDFAHTFTNTSSSNQVTFRIGGVQSGGTLSSGCQMTVISAPDFPSNFDITPSMFLPKMKQKDFLAGVAKMFNLVFVPSKQVPNRITAYSYNDWIAIGAVKNWNEVVDISQPITIKPTTELQGKSIKMRMAQGNSLLDVAYESAYKYPHGSVEVNDTNNEFAEGEIVIEAPFAATITNRINSNTTFEVIQMFDAEGKPVDSPPRMLYYQGLNDTSDYYIFRASDGTFQVQSEYPIFSVSSGTFTATYGIPQLEGVKPPKNNLLTEYYSTYLLELYATDAVMMEVSVVLEPIEVFGLNLNDQVYYDGEYWRINKMTGYNPDTMTAKVELFRASFVNSSLCANTITSLNNNGTITFNGTATQECCEFYGYRWVDNACYWRTSKYVKAASAGLVGLEKAPIANVKTTTSRPTDTKYWYEATSDEEATEFRCVALHNYATPLFAMEEGERQLVRISAVCSTYSYQLDYSIERGAGGDTITAINPSISDRYNVSIQTANGFASYLQLDYVGGTAVAETWSIMAERQQLL
jgi:hypothetical protein